MAYCKLFRLRQFAIEKQGKGNDSTSVSGISGAWSA